MSDPAVGTAGMSDDSGTSSLLRLSGQLAMQVSVCSVYVGGKRRSTEG